MQHATEHTATCDHGRDYNRDSPWTPSRQGLSRRFTFPLLSGTQIQTISSYPVRGTYILKRTAARFPSQRASHKIQRRCDHASPFT